MGPQNLMDTDNIAAPYEIAVIAATAPCALAIPWTFCPLLIWL